MIIILLILSILPVYIFGRIDYKNDFDKEPTSILIKLFFCGIGATILTTFITMALAYFIPFFQSEEGLNVIELIPYTFIGIALIEEFSKWIFVYKLEYNDNEFNHLYDGIVYAGFVALGFACIENILYVIQSDIQTAIFRAFLAIPGHLCDGIMMGYYLSLAKLSLINNNPKLSKKNKLLSLFVPVMTHGVYDYLLYAASATENAIFTFAFLMFIVFFFNYCYGKAMQFAKNYYNLNPNYISKHQQKELMGQIPRENTISICPKCGMATSEHFCSNCGYHIK